MNVSIQYCIDFFYFILQFLDRNQVSEKREEKKAIGWSLCLISHFDLTFYTGLVYLTEYIEGVER
jgi:hypothetical protein